MNQRFLVAVLTIVVFLAGYGARVLTERERPLPPPPAVLSQELSRNAPAVDAKATQRLDRAKLLAEIEKFRPQIEAYRTQVMEIDGEFDREFAALLNPEQREKFTTNQKKAAEWRAKRDAQTTPLSDEDIERQSRDALTSIYWKVTVTPLLERRTKEYNLDAAQQTTTRALLTLRRSKFIALLDSSPHPSIRLSRLAPLIERVAAPAENQEKK
jgi:hypothetical protein